MGVVTGLQRHTVALDRLIERNGNVFAMNLEGLGAGGEALPIEFDAGGFENADGHVRNFGPMPSPGIKVTLCAFVCGIVSSFAIALSASCLRALLVSP